MRISRDITKEEIFKVADDITIFSKYLDLSESVIIECIEKNKLINSPVRYDDNDASAGFRYNSKGKLKLKDFSGYFWGDCFDLVAFILQRNVANKQDFIEVLKHIYATVTAKSFDKISTYKANRDSLSKVARSKRVIEIETRAWNVHDKSYWGDLLYKESHVFEYLERGSVYPVQHYWMDRASQPSHKYYYKANDPCYAYFFGYDADGIANYRLYFPFRTKPFPKFITNNAAWQGLSGLRDEVDALLFTKSYKDVLAVKSFLRNHPLRIDVIAPPSENHYVSRQEYEWLVARVKGRFKKSGKPAVMSLYDFDRAGLFGSGQLKREFGVPRIMFTDGKYGTAVTGNKDFAATIPMYGKIEFLKLINKFVENLDIV